ncbi:choice-of-anchor G family protein [Brevibacterium sp. 1718]|uniref:choice-of-anchor G family protein n=1 Tax=Brevibacterium sp. 1718 TaxID=3413510 RepID=UPI003DA852E5
MVGTTSASALGLDNYPDDPTEAEASVAGMSLDSKDLVAAAQSKAGSKSDPGPNREAFNGALGGDEVIDFGAGYQIPVDDFIDFGQAGAIESESTASDAKNGKAVSGIVGADGGLSLDGKDSDFGTAQVDLLSIVAASGSSDVTDGLIDQADLNLGLGGAWVEAIDGEFQDPDSVGKYGQYRVGDAKLQLHSPAIDDAGDGVSDAAGEMEGEVNDALNEALGLTDLLPGMTVDASVESSIKDDVLDAILLEPITTDDGLATIDLGEGSIEVDVGRIGGNDDGVIDRPVGMNNQDPNTELIDDETYPFIASSVHDVIEKVIDVAVDTAIESLRSATVNVDITAPDGTKAGWDMDLTGKVSNDSCDAAGATGTVTCGTINTVMKSMDTVMGPVYDELSDPSGLLYKAFTTIKTDMMTVPIRAALDPFLKLIADNLVSLQINHQETTECTAADGSTTVNGVEVSALSLGVGDGTARLGIGNAGVRTDSCDESADGPSIDTSSPAPAGGETTLDSTGWAPDTDVTVELNGPDGEPVGDPITVTTDGDGNFPKGTVLPIPADVTPGDFTIVGTDPDGNTGEGDVTVYAPDLTVAGPVYPGDCAVIKSGGWAPDSEITVQLNDAEGKPVGDPVTATADKNGDLPDDTCVTVPDGTEPGDFTVVGSDDNGASIDSPLTVAEAGTPIVSVTTPAPAGTDIDVTSRGWSADADVTFELTDPDGKSVGDNVTVTADGEGNVPEGTTLPIPDDAAAGDYTLTATDPDDNSAKATVSVYAPTIETTSPVVPGQDAAVKSTGWLPSSEIKLQLVDADGKDAGDAVNVTTDGNGNVPDDPVLTIPEDAEPGDFTVRASDDNEAEVEASVTVAEPSIDVSSPVPAGGEASLKSAGWKANTSVELTLANADGDVVGSPVIATADGEGALPDGTKIQVPEDTKAGDLTVTGTASNETTAKGTFEVYAPSIEASSPVPAGDETTLTSSGWLPETEVSIRLALPSAKPDDSSDDLGKAITVTTDEEGAVPEDTKLPVPAETAGGDFAVVGTDDNGAEAAATIEVTSAGSDDDANASSNAGGDDANASSNAGGDDANASSNAGGDDANASSNAGGDDANASSNAGGDDANASSNAGGDDANASSNAGSGDVNAGAGDEGVSSDLPRTGGEIVPIFLAAAALIAVGAAARYTFRNKTHV